MHINLILGGVVIFALWWLIRLYRSSRSTPADMLRDEIDKIKMNRENASQTSARLYKMQEEALQGVLQGLDSMRKALSDQDLQQGLLQWQYKNGIILLHICSRSCYARSLESGVRPEPEEFIISWNMPEIDLGELASSKPLIADGEYTLQMKKQFWARERELNTFLRFISSVIAERLVE